MSVKRQQQIRNIITDLYDSEFPSVPQEEIFITESEETKDEIIDHYVKRLIFCDKIKPKIKSFNDMDIDMDTIVKIQCSDAIRREIYKDIKKSKFFKDIEEKYLYEINK